MRPQARRGTGLLLLLGLGLVRYHGALLAPGLLADEGRYFGAFERVLAGGSPYEATGYYYPPAFAAAGAAALAHLGEHATAIGLRLANLAGVVAACACAVRWMPARRLARGLTAAALLALSPPAVVAVTYGNLSGLACGLVLLSLVLWRRAPAPAGTLLGGSLVLKPIGALVLMVALARRARPAWMAAGCTVAVAGAGLAVGAQDLPAMVTRSSQAHELSSTSIVHVLDCFGVRAPGVLVMAIVAVAAVVAVRVRRMPWHGVALVACSASVLASPLVWDHTMILALPLVVATLTPPFRRLLRASRAGRSRALLSALVSALGALVLFGTREWTEVSSVPRPVQGALGCAPLLALVVMTVAAVSSAGGSAAGPPRGRAPAGGPR
jgi:hypothetical protein